MLGPGVANAGVMDPGGTVESPRDLIAHVIGGSVWTQSFTPSLTGFLDQVDLPLTWGQSTPSANLNVQIFLGTAGDSPTGSALATETVAIGDVPPTAPPPAPFLAVAINPTPTVTAGTKYVIQLSTVAGGSYFWYGAGSNAYAGGAAQLNGAPGALIADLAFRTYVAATATAVSFRGASAVRTAKGVLVRWRTAPLLEVLGYNVFREVKGKRVRVNGNLIGPSAAGSHSLLDRRAPALERVRYWIQVVNLDGSRAWYGPTRSLRPW